MFKDISKKEETVLKKAFNNWGIFDLYEKLYIIIKPLENKNLAKFEGKFRAGFLKKVNLAQIEKKTPPKNNGENENDKKNDGNSEVYVCSNNDQKELAIKMQPTYSGIAIGNIKSKKFTPNLNFAELIVNHNPKLNYPYAVLENKASNLYIYGRDIMGNSIVDFFNEIKENQIVIILNQKKEVLGIGRSRFNNNLITQNDKIVIDNVQDIGTHYLKEENSYTL
jgi:60S ribosome subunit biogenesis protein NIP7